MFKVGSRDEPKDYQGLSHFAEHLFFRGTAKRPEARLISTEIDQYGGIINAYTDYDVTAYFIKINSKHLEHTLEIMSDIIFNSQFQVKHVNSEKKVVLNELNLYQNNPDRLVSMMVRSLVFRKTNLEHDVGGNPKVIKKATQEQFLKYVANFYQPENMIICLAGNLTRSSGKNTTLEKVAQLVTRYFNQDFTYIDRLTPAQIKRKKAKFPPRTNYQRTFPNLQKEPRCDFKVNPKLEGSYLVLGFPAPACYTEDYYSALVLTAILGKGMSSRLFTEVREKRGLVYRISSDLDSYPDLGTLIVSCATHSKDLTEVFEVIWQELIKLTKPKSISPGELNKAKEYIMGVHQLAMENTSFLARKANYEILHYGKIITYEEYNRKVRAVKTPQVIKMAKTIFDHNKINLAIISNGKVKFGNFRFSE